MRTAKRGHLLKTAAAFLWIVCSLLLLVVTVAYIAEKFGLIGVIAALVVFPGAIALGPFIYWVLEGTISVFMFALWFGVVGGMAVVGFASKDGT